MFLAAYDSRIDTGTFKSFKDLSKKDQRALVKFLRRNYAGGTQRLAGFMVSRELCGHQLKVTDRSGHELIRFIVYES